MIMITLTNVTLNMAMTMMSYVLLLTIRLVVAVYLLILTLKILINPMISIMTKIKWIQMQTNIVVFLIRAKVAVLSLNK